MKKRAHSEKQAQQLLVLIARFYIDVFVERNRPRILPTHQIQH